MRLVVFERHALRIVAATLVVRGGSVGLSQQSPAAVRLMVDSLMYGTQRRSEQQIFQVLNQNFMQLASHAGDTWLDVTLRAPSAGFDEALATLRDVALEPTFPPFLVDLARQRLIGEEVTHPDQPSLIAQRNLFVSLWGLRHPFTVALASPAQDLRSVTRNDVAAAWRDLMDPAESTLVIAGDVNPLVVRQSVATLFGAWARNRAAPPLIPIPPAAPAAGPHRIVAVDRPGARQVTVIYGGRSSDDSAPWSVARALALQLLELAEIRAKSAAAGGARGGNWHPQWNVPATTFWWEKAVPADQARSVLQELDGWMRDLRGRGPDASDLNLARARLMRSTPWAFETVEYMATLGAYNVRIGLPPDWRAKAVASTATMPWEQIRAALLDPDQMRVVVVGDLSLVMDQLLQLGWGPVDVHDTEGHLLRTVSR
jgi:zinc protease